jgi:membrane protease YdiL (CAAX protease family)
MEVLFAYSSGAVFGYLLIKMGGLTAPVVAHGFGNIVLYMVAQWL